MLFRFCHAARGGVFVDEVGTKYGCFDCALVDRTESLTSYVSRIEAARDGCVGGAFDDGAAVREKRHLVWILPELQNEGIVADCAVRWEAAVHFGEVDRALALMDLHRISAAEGDVRAAFSGKMDEVAFAAGAASGAGFGGGDFGVLVGPDV